MACKPDFVQGLPPWMAIPLGAWLPTCSSCRPGPRAKAAHARSLFGIAPGGACRATAVTSRAVGSYPTVSPLPPAKRGALRERRSVLCGAFPRVTPAGRYPAPLPCGVRTFLGFPRPSSAGFPTHGTQDTGHNPSIYVYVTFTLYGLTFQTSSTSSTGIVIDRAYNTTCPYRFRRDSV
jgi:hypothetical protein